MKLFGRTKDLTPWSGAVKVAGGPLSPRVEPVATTLSPSPWAEATRLPPNHRYAMGFLSRPGTYRTGVTNW